MEDCTQVANEADDVQITQGSSSANKEQWNTKLGSTLAYILGNTDDVIEFDRARENAKNQRQDKFLLDNYMHKLAINQTKVSKKMYSSKYYNKWKQCMLDINNNFKKSESSKGKPAFQLHSQLYFNNFNWPFHLFIHAQSPFEL